MSVIGLWFLQIPPLGLNRWLGSVARFGCCLPEQLLAWIRAFSSVFLLFVRIPLLGALIITLIALEQLFIYENLTLSFAFHVSVHLCELVMDYFQLRHLLLTLLHQFQTTHKH